VRERREAGAVEGLACVAGHRARLREQKEECTRVAMRKMLRLGDLIQRDDGKV